MLSTLAFLIVLSLANVWLILHGFMQTERAATARSIAGLTVQGQETLLRQAQAEARATMTQLGQAAGLATWQQRRCSVLRNAVAAYRGTHRWTSSARRTGITLTTARRP